MKPVTTEIEYFMVRKAECKAVISHVKAYGIHSAIIFTIFTPDEAAKEFGITEKHYFITRISTYGQAYDGIGNTKNKASFEVTKEEGNQIYKEVKARQTFNYDCN
ncbi:MAG: hypothetical protein II453_01720 [Alphaproteobacteria bacterium]|nr:hypothetical protein [Alphaproteobacteria bacterium]